MSSVTACLAEAMAIPAGPAGPAMRALLMWAADRGGEQAPSVDLAYVDLAELAAWLGMPGGVPQLVDTLARLVELGYVSTGPDPSTGTWRLHLADPQGWLEFP